MDVVEVARLQLALNRTSEFAEVVFTAEERQAADSNLARTRQLAAIFAAKEAFLKAVGVGLWRGIPLKEIEVVRSDIDRSVTLRLGPRAVQALNDKACVRAVLSLSHHQTTAMAVVIIC